MSYGYQIAPWGWPRVNEYILARGPFPRMNKGGDDPSLGRPSTRTRKKDGTRGERMHARATLRMHARLSYLV